MKVEVFVAWPTTPNAQAFAFDLEALNVKYTPLETAQWADRSLSGNNVATLQSFGTQGDPGTSTVVQEYTSGAWIST